MGKRILLADDSVTIQKVVELTFMEEDYEVVAVGNGDEALAEFEASPPDLLIADVHMPGANGYEVCRQAKDGRPDVPVLLLVGTFEPFDEGEAEGAGADGFLKKPFDSQELLRRVEELLTAAAEALPAIVDDDVDAAPIEIDEVFETEDVEAPPAGFDFGGSSAEAEGSSEEPVAEASGLDDELPEDEMPDLPPASDSEESEPELPVAAGSEADQSTATALADGDIDRIARRVVELLGDQILRDVAWEVVPDLAELAIKDRIRELEQQLE